MQEFSPTTKIIILPYPVKTLVPLNRIGEGTSCFPAEFFYPLCSNSCMALTQASSVFLLMGSDYPVMALSSVVT
jgi:hypothetical protein